jgi:uncharacterized protein with HEPN domain
MERDSRTFLWDARESADAIARFTAGRTSEQYLADEMLRAAVERHFEIIGEALNRLSQTDPGVAAKVPDIRQAIAFGNLLIHGYASIDDRIVWRTASEDLPKMREAIAPLLVELGGEV